MFCSFPAYYFYVEISQVGEKVKYNEPVELNCATAVDKKWVIGNLKWARKVDQQQKDIIKTETGTTIDEDKVHSNLTIDVTEEWIGAEILCGVEYMDTTKDSNPLDSVTRWSKPHRLNGRYVGVNVIFVAL